MRSDMGRGRASRMENTYREIVPTIEEIMQMYEDMVTQVLRWADHVRCCCSLPRYAPSQRCSRV
eukprot:3363356-Rhodomonas_salina.3